MIKNSSGICFADDAQTELLQLLTLENNVMNLMPGKQLTATLVALGMAAITAAPAMAVTYDLTVANTTVNLYGGIFITNSAGSTGTGVIDAFERLQGSPTTTGLNSNSSNANLLAETKSGTWTHDITLADLGTKNISGTNYYVILLDVNTNQSSGSNIIDLNTFQLYTRSTSITANGGADSLAEVQTGGTKQFDIDGGFDAFAATDNTFTLNSGLNSGSGSGDLWLYIPTSLFSEATSSSFLYLYSQFGFTANIADTGGFQEWATVRGLDTPPPPSVPDGGTTMALLGLGLVAVAAFQRKLRR